ncbi:MAG: hypothetical protein ACWA5K_02560 [bacterium]
MLNYRLITLLTITFCVLAPLGASWVMAEQEAWYRPYLVWLLFIIAVMLWQRRSRYDDPQSN